MGNNLVNNEVAAQKAIPFDELFGDLNAGVSTPIAAGNGYFSIADVLNEPPPSSFDFEDEPTNFRKRA